MAEDRDLKVGMSMLDDLVKQVETLGWVALSFEAVMGKDPILSPDEHANITVRAKGILKDCEIVEKKIGSDPKALSLLNYVKGRAYAVYLPGKLLPIPRIKSHKKQAITCYEKAINLTSSDKWKGVNRYYLGRLYDVWGNKREAIENLEKAVNLLTVDDPTGMEAAKVLERLKTKKKGLCFIATAVYGSPLAEEVVALQNFRDEVLTKFTLGKLFATCYSYFSPPIAHLIAHSELLRKIVRGSIISFSLRLVMLYRSRRGSK